jgi:hypothetical protein
MRHLWFLTNPHVEQSSQAAQSVLSPQPCCPTPKTWAMPWECCSYRVVKLSYALCHIYFRLQTAVNHSSLINTSGSFHSIIVVLPDLNNMCLAVGISLLMCIEAEMYVISYLLLVNGHLWFTTCDTQASEQYSHWSEVSPCCLTLKIGRLVGISLLSWLRADVHVTLYLLPVLVGATQYLLWLHHLSAMPYLGKVTKAFSLAPNGYEIAANVVACLGVLSEPFMMFEGGY